MVKKIDCSLKKNRRNKKCLRDVGEAIFSIIIPKGDNSNNKISQKSIKKYINRMNSRFGGTTTKPITLGCWTDEKRKKLQCEVSLKVSAYTDFDSTSRKDLTNLDVTQRQARLKSDYNFMRRIAKEMANEFGQDTIPVIYDNVRDIDFVKGVWKKKINKKLLSGKKTPKDPFKKHI